MVPKILKISASRLNVLLIEDHAIVREGLDSLLRTREEILDVMQVESVSQAVQTMKSISVDLIISDYFLSDGTALDVLFELKFRGLDIPVLVLSITDKEDIVQTCLEHGAKGFALKSAGIQQLMDAIQTVVAGKQWVSESLSIKSRSKSSTNLTAKELIILKMVARGLSNDDIAIQTKTSINTIKSHMYHIMQKIGVENRSAAVNEAKRLGLIVDSSS